MLIALTSSWPVPFSLRSPEETRAAATCREGRMEDIGTQASTAPATSGAPSGETRPTMAQAFEAHPLTDTSASPTDTPTPTDSQTATPADATAPPVTDSNAPETPALEGWMPTQRHKAVLNNAYQERDNAIKERDAVRTENVALKAQFGSPEHQQLTRWQQSFNQSPEGWIEQTFSELAVKHPEKVPQFRSVVARILGSRTPPADAVPNPMDPDIPVYNETGQLVAQTFSADKVKAIVTQAVNDALQREVGPMKQDFTQRRQLEEARQIHQQATDTATQQFEAAKKWPGFLSDPAKGTVDPDAVKAFSEHPDWDLKDVYINVVVPKLRAKEQSEVLDSLKTKAAAASGVNPSGAVVAATRRVTSLTDPSLVW